MFSKSSGFFQLVEDELKQIADDQEPTNNVEKHPTGEAKKKRKQKIPGLLTMTIQEFHKLVKADEKVHQLLQSKDGLQHFTGGEKNRTYRRLLRYISHDLDNPISFNELFDLSEDDAKKRWGDFYQQSIIQFVERPIAAPTLLEASWKEVQDACRRSSKLESTAKICKTDKITLENLFKYCSLVNNNAVTFKAIYRLSSVDAKHFFGDQFEQPIHKFIDSSLLNPTKKRKGRSSGIIKPTDTRLSLPKKRVYTTIELHELVKRKFGNSKQALPADLIPNAASDYGNILRAHGFTEELRKKNEKDQGSLQEVSHPAVTHTKR